VAKKGSANRTSVVPGHLRFKRAEDHLVPICAVDRLHDGIYNIARSILWVVDW